jgi:rod shape-determining protein MreD
MNKTLLRWFGLFVLVFVLQTTLLPIISIFGVQPDLIMLTVCYFGFKTDVIPALFVGFIVGLGQDFYDPVILGHNALCKTVVGFFTGLFNEKVMRIDPVFQLTFIAISFIIHDIIYYTVLIFKADITLPMMGIQLLTVTLPRTLYTLIFALIPIFWELSFPSHNRR